MQSEELFKEVSAPENFEFVKNVITTMEKDPVFNNELITILNQQKIETRVFIYWAVKHLQPKKYLEIGTRRGWSLGTVCAAAPECEVYSFDWWQFDYGNCPNPGPAFVSGEMKKLGYQKLINFFNGDSHKTIPQFFKDNPNMEFDLILVDGDHSPAGALDDLKNTMPHVKVGGILLFDDIFDEAGLADVFDSLKNIFPNFEYHAYNKNRPGIGVAIRTS